MCCVSIVKHTFSIFETVIAHWVSSGLRGSLMPNMDFIWRKIDRDLELEGRKYRMLQVHHFIKTGTHRADADSLSASCHGPHTTHIDGPLGPSGS